MRLKPLLVTAAGLAVIGALAFVATRPAARLVAMNLFGPGFATPAASAATPTAASTAADPSALDVDFARGTGLGGLEELLPELTLRREVRDGWLRIAGVPFAAGWYSDRSGPFVFRRITGDVMVETTVRSVSRSDPGARPSGSFNSAGLMMRDPTSTTGAMRWVMHNIGFQDSFYGSEAKTTIPETGDVHPHRLAGFRSASTLWLTPAPAGVIEATLRMCRIGPEVRMYRRYAGETAFVEETLRADTVAQGNGLSRPTAGVAGPGPIRFLRPDLPATLEVGLIVNPGFPPNDGEGWFRGVSFRRIASFDACVAG